MAPRKEISILLERLELLESQPRTPDNAAVLDIGIDAIRDRLAFLSRLCG